MMELQPLIERAQAGDRTAFGSIVRRFQDMAVGYAYSLLGDFTLAEDAAQEAFVQVYLDLQTLDQPQAFPSWFRASSTSIVTGSFAANACGPSRFMKTIPWSHQNCAR